MSLSSCADVLVFERVPVVLAEEDDFAVLAGVLDVRVGDVRLGAGERATARGRAARAKRRQVRIMGERGSPTPSRYSNLRADALSSADLRWRFPALSRGAPRPVVRLSRRARAPARRCRSVKAASRATRASASGGDDARELRGQRRARRGAAGRDGPPGPRPPTRLARDAAAIAPTRARAPSPPRARAAPRPRPPTSGVAREGAGRRAGVVDATTTTMRSASPPSTRTAAAASASRPACIPPPTEKLGPVRPKAIEHSPGDGVRRRVREAPRLGGPGAALADARGEEGVRLERRERRCRRRRPAPASGPHAPRGARTAASASRTSASAREQPVDRRARDRGQLARRAARGRRGPPDARTPSAAAPAAPAGPAADHERGVGAAEGRGELERRARRAGDRAIEQPGRRVRVERRPRRRPQAGRRARSRRRTARSSSAPAAPSVCPICALNGCTTTSRAALGSERAARWRAHSAASLNGVAVPWALTRSTAGLPASSSAAAARAREPAPFAIGRRQVHGVRGGAEPDDERAASRRRPAARGRAPPRPRRAPSRRDPTGRGAAAATP